MSIITLDYFKTCLYHDDPLSGRQRVGRSLKCPSVGPPCKGHCSRMWPAATLWVAGSCCAVKSWKSQNYLRYFGSFNLFAVNKDILFRWVNCVVVYLLFSRYRVRISGMFLQLVCLRSFFGWSCPLKRAVYSTPDSQCLECYIYRLSTLDTMQKIGVWEWVGI